MNKNTIHFLKNEKYNKNFKIHNFFNNYCKILSDNKLNSDDFLIDNGGVLALYGLRDSHDIDFISVHNVCCNEKKCRLYEYFT